MRPLLHPTLVNGRTGDPALYLETMFEKDAILFDLGDISSLPPRKIHRLAHIFVSHTHIDHFVGFDYVLRVLAGRQKKVHLYGPAGFIGHVQHKLHAYRWNLVDGYSNDLIFVVTEIEPSFVVRITRFRLKNAFAPEFVGESQMTGNILLNERAFRVSAAILEHRIPCLAFAVEEAGHVNIWRNRLEEMGLSVGPWLRELKQAVFERRPDEHQIETGVVGARMPLGALRTILTVTPGQRIAYVTDAADTPANRQSIIQLVHGADMLFIEAAFSKEDAPLAAARAHLTTSAAGEIARVAQVRRVEPFHFSARYSGDEKRLLREVMDAFAGRKPESEEPVKNRFLP